MGKTLLCFYPLIQQQEDTMHKVAVINFSGNVGKSSIAHYLLAPRLGCSVLSIESINDSASSDNSLRGKESEALQAELVTNDSLVVDVGASNVEAFVDSISQFEAGIDELDLFIVPTVPANKQQTDTLATIDQLNIMGVNKKDIRVVLNQFDKKSGPLERQYSQIFKSHAQYETFELSSESYLPKHSFFEAFQNDDRTWDDVLNDDTDYRQLIADTDDKDKKLLYARKIGLKQLANGINRDLDRVFGVIFDA